MKSRDKMKSAKQANLVIFKWLMFGPGEKTTILEG